MQSCGVYITSCEANEMINEFGHNVTGKGINMNFDDFLRLMLTKEGEDAWNEGMLEAFKFFDKDRSGNISFDEIKTVMQAIGEDICDEEIVDMIKEADIDEDGEVNYEEFLGMMSGKE